VELDTARRAADAASLHKSAFLATMSHELRTPLNSILGFAQLLQEQTKEALSTKQTRFLTNIYTSGQHLLQLINDILDLSKVEAGKIVLNLQSLSVATTLEDLLVIARGLANQKGQTLQVEVAPGLPALTADPIRFKQIFFNLASNAVKFTPDGGRITVRACTVPAGEQRSRGAGEPGAPQPPSPSAPLQFLELAVADTGVGIRPEDLPRLFKEFTQLETTAAQAHEGTGLGLALTKRLVELHGGTITAASDGEGQGSTFTVRLPFGGPTGGAEK
jgi:signal transduction histidine kinase